MPTNLREQAETDLAVTLEGDFGLPVELTGPDGLTQSVTGQVLFDHRELNPDTGEEIVIAEPVVTLRRASLSRIPQPGETWFVKIPQTPSTSATLAPYVINRDRPPEGGGSIGFIRLYLQKARQADDDEV